MLVEKASERYENASRILANAWLRSSNRVRREVIDEEQAEDAQTKTSSRTSPTKDTHPGASEPNGPQ